MRQGRHRLLMLGMMAALAASSPGYATAKSPSRAMEPIRQIALGDDMLARFIAARPALDDVLAKVAADSTADPRLMRTLNETARKNGFADYEDYEAAATNIVWILSGIDPLSKKYIGVQAVTKLEVADLLADKSLSLKDHKLLLEALHMQMLSAAPVKYAANVTLVTKFYDKLVQPAARD